MTIYYVDDGGSATAPYDTWAKAATSLSALDDAVAFASGDIVYIGHDHVCQYVHATHRTITGPASGLPTIVISATQGSDPPTYQKSSTNQIDTSEGAYQLLFDGSFALYGICMTAGARIQLVGNDSNESCVAVDCTLKLAAGSDVYMGALACSGYYRNLTIDLTADGTTPRSGGVINGTAGYFEINGLAFVNAGYRTGVVSGHPGPICISGADFSGFTNASLCEIVTREPKIWLNNCKTAATWGLVNSGSSQSGAIISAVNVGSDDAPTALMHYTYTGDSVSTASIYRTSGAQIEGVSTAWLITTTASCGEGAPSYTPWIYAALDSTGSKTFDLYVTNDTADFTDAEVWLEVEYMGTADEPQYSLATDQRATITTTAAAQTDDTSSTWTGAGPSYTYKQKLSVTATVNETGLYRARVAVGVTSIASSRYFYVDPKVTVS